MVQPSVCVTGASGFVGRALTEALVRGGWQVRAAVRSMDLRIDPRVVVAGGVRLDRDFDWTPVISASEVVVHVAARVHVMHESAADPLGEFRAINVDGTLRLAQQAAARGVRRFVFISTIGVLGTASPQGPFTSTSPVNAQSPYALSKWEAEQALCALGAQTGMEIVIIRPPLVYGHGAPGNFATMVKWLRRGWPLPLGLVDNRRSLIGIDNLVDLIALCMVHPDACEGTWLAADGEDVSTPDLMRRMARALGMSARLLPVPVQWLRLGAALTGRANLFTQLCESLQVDTSETRTRLGWTPPCTLDEGLARVAGRTEGGHETLA